ncbi:uncharacterized protein LOC127248597 [Andrographis paniculata]|uniref:uncharacterized protein LOC127248597 n=1 Tax=Andrographis paniculata TaxID=175694 RepID=UPI0021E818B0|nr:uncharacterized protein LOC127248597 [Andrographis paniculata]
MEAAAALELEDDVFFKDLSRQISLLIMDDEDDGPGCDDSIAHCPSLNLQAFNREIYPVAPGLVLDYNQQMNKREIKGTGVFIPRSMANPRRKNMRQGRFTASGNKFQRISDQSPRGALPHMTANYSSQHHNDHSSANPRRS